MDDLKKLLSEDLEQMTSSSKFTKDMLQPDLNFQRSVQCPVCQDRGIIFDGDVARPCHCMQQKRLENRFRHARMAKNLLNCRIENFHINYYESNDGSNIHKERATKALNAVIDLIKAAEENRNYGLGLLLTGAVGSGKTFLAAAIANALIENNKEVLFLVVPDLLDELRSTYNRSADTSELDLLDTAREVAFLVLDDLGAHNYTEWTRNRIYSIINYRLNEHLPTIITSNLSLEEMEEYLGDRTTSRILQMCRVFRLSCEEDIRSQLYQERENRLRR